MYRKLFGVRHSLFFNVTIQNSLGKKLQNGSGRTYFCINLSDALIFMKSGLCTKCYTMLCGLCGVPLFADQILNKM